MARIVLIFLLCTAVSAEVWPYPRFSQPEIATNPGHVELKCDSVNNCKVTIDEAVTELLYIAKLNYKGGASVTVQELGDTNYLKPEIQSFDGDMYIVTNTPQTYNQTGSLPLSLYITIEAVASDYLNVLVRDINNNRPVLTMDNQVCLVEENFTGTTTCIIMLTDEDTVCNDTQVHVSISGSPDENDVFSLDVKPLKKCNKEITLVVSKNKLDYETQRIYQLDIKVTDGPWNVSERMVVEVGDVADMAPIWEMSPTKNLVEEREYEMTLDARDGDVGLNEPLTYSIEFVEDNEGYDKFFTLDPETGKLNISAIDRDIFTSKMFYVNATAFDSNNQTSFLILFIVIDLNDNSPTIVGGCNLIMEFEEGTISTLDNIIIMDMDEGKNGTFFVYLEDEPEKNFTDLFRVIPNVGYQNQSFSISVTKPTLLDYENADMKHFTFELVAEEQSNSSHVERCEVKVSLKDVNDEYPIFTNIGDQNVTENAPDGKLITTLKATDKDDGDTLTYSTTSTSVRVDESTGEVTAIVGKFDHEMQDKMIIQVSVQDNATNSATAQFVLNILDENDNPPNIFIPSGRVPIKENYTLGYVVTEIYAKDVDTSADLHFHINWNESSATQRGSIQDPNVFMGTFAMNDSCDCNKGEYKACSCLQINKLLDWINMDTLYLNIKVTDEQTDVNATDDSALLVVVIEDLNNHEPEFQIIDNLRVPENSSSGIKIGSVIAVDNKDGPGNNNVTYILEEINDTPPDLVEIDGNGILTVGKSKEIDYEKYQKLFYSVTAVDGDFHPYVNITIDVDDINDNSPRIILNGNPAPIEELSDPGFVFEVDSEDGDLSKQFNTPTYMLDGSRNSPVIPTLFHIDNATGVITTIDKLDYLKGSEYVIWILVQDNLDASKSLTDYANITVKVLDMNNHHPEFQEPKECEASPQEDVTMNSLIVQVQATDQDTETDFKEVLYSITDIISVNAPEDPPNNLFTIDENSGKIHAGMDLRGYIGNYNITVMGRNKDTITPQNNTQSFTICVQDINDSPSIIYPTIGQVIQLQEEQMINDVLILYTKEKLQAVTAIDKDMGKNAMVDFSIYDKGAGSTNEYFYMNAIDTKSANLQLKRLFQIPGDRQFEIVINATDRGVPAISTTTSITIQVLTDGHPPYFEQTNATTNFKENDPNANFIITPAKDYDNEFKDGCDGTYDYIKKHHAPTHFERTPARLSHKYSNGCDEIIYSIEGGNDEGLFFMDKNVLRLNKPLDYESKPDDPKYELKIVATNPDGKRWNGWKTKDNSSILELTVNIVNENDCYPQFDKKSFSGGISVGDKPGKVIQKFKAIDLDKDDEVTYALLEDTMTADDSLKSHIKDINLNSAGELTLDFFPDVAMHGYFSFQIVANDKEFHNDTADVRVYIIADSNRHNFLFDNHKEFIDKEKYTIEEIFTKYIGYNCSVENIIMEGYSYTQELNQTSVIAYFIDVNESLPVDNDVTELLINEKAKEIKGEFKKYVLNWVNSTPEDKSADNGGDQSALTQTVLIVVSALLATLVLLLLATFFFKIRSYNRRLEALSETKFGSQDSGLNRVNMNVPNTNQHALEGSNPVWNEELGNEDDISQGSGDSELVGVEDNPEFSPQNHRMEARRGSKNPIFDDIENEKEWSSVEYSPDINMNEEKNPNFSFGPPTTNVPTTEL